MTSVNTVNTIWSDLLNSINIETLLPKFPARATKCVRELARIARERKDYEELHEYALHELTEEGTPELIFYVALKSAALPQSPNNPYGYLPFMPLLEEALDAQRRCRVCGCTDYNGCICGCSWVAGDLCSECYELLRGGDNYAE